MIVGFLRKEKTPSKLARLLSYTCKYNDLELVYMTPEGINLDKATVQGKMLIDQKWENVIVPLPKYIDVNPHLFSYKKYTKIMNYLKKETQLSINRRNLIKKDVLQEELRKHTDLYRYGIKGNNLTNFDELIKFINDNEQIVVKPVNGLQGKSVIVVKKIDDDNYVIGEQKNKEKYTKTELLDFYNKELKKTNYLMQKYIISRNNTGDPFDCRIHLEKGANNKWIIANMFIRIGIGQSIVSNVNQGGGISRVGSFLQANYAEKAKEIENHLRKMAETMAVEVEKITDTQLATMGLDVGIDPDGNLFVFEINGFPIVGPQLSEITLIRPQYYKYILQKQETVYKSSEDQVEYKKINQNRVNQENIRLKKQLKNIKFSTSWKMTKPIRKIGRIIKVKK